MKDETSSCLFLCTHIAALYSQPQGLIHESSSTNGQTRLPSISAARNLKAVSLFRMKSQSFKIIGCSQKVMTLSEPNDLIPQTISAHKQKTALIWLCGTYTFPFGCKVRQHKINKNKHKNFKISLKIENFQRMSDELKPLFPEFAKNLCSGAALYHSVMDFP